MVLDVTRRVKEGELLCGVADTVLADLKAPGRAQGYF